jgi:hypothetical protein
MCFQYPVSHGEGVWWKLLRTYENAVTAICRRVANPLLGLTGGQIFLKPCPDILGTSQPYLFRITVEAAESR